MPGGICWKTYLKLGPEGPALRWGGSRPPTFRMPSEVRTKNRGSALPGEASLPAPWLALGFPTEPAHTETGPWGGGEDGWVVGTGCWPPGEAIAAVCPLISKTPPSFPFLSLCSDILLSGMSSTVCLPILIIFVLKAQLRPHLLQEVFPGLTCVHRYFSSG